MCFKMLQAIGLEIPLDMKKYNSLFETTTIFFYAKEVHNGVYMEAHDVEIQVLGRIFQAHMNFHQANLINKPSQAQEKIIITCLKTI